jgi:cell division protein FtsL
MSKNTKKTKVVSTERILLIFIFAILLAIPVCNVYTKTMLSKTNIELEEVKYEIKKQESINDGLKMEISELASLDKVQDVAIDNGLTYQNGNIKVVTTE